MIPIGLFVGIQNALTSKYVHICAWDTGLLQSFYLPQLAKMTGKPRSYEECECVIAIQRGWLGVIHARMQLTSWEPHMKTRTIRLLMKLTWRRSGFGPVCHDWQLQTKEKRQQLCWKLMMLSNKAGNWTETLSSQKLKEFCFLHDSKRKTIIVASVMFSILFITLVTLCWCFYWPIFGQYCFQTCRFIIGWFSDNIVFRRVSLFIYLFIFLFIYLFFFVFLFVCL